MKSPPCQRGEQNIALKSNATPSEIAEIAAKLSAYIAQGHAYDVRGNSWRDVAINYLDDLHDDMQAFAKEMEE